MKIFIDTASLKEIQEASDMGILDGVTTNPSLMAKEGVKDYRKHYFSICEIVHNGDVSAEVIAIEQKAIVKEGIELAKIHKNIVVKVPIIKEGVKAIKTLAEKGIRVNCTLIFSPSQALIAAKAGAYCVSPFVGRIDDVSGNGIQLIQQIVAIFQNYSIETQVLAASLRHPLHFVQCAESGAHISTMPFKVLEQLIRHPLTDVGLEKFLEDHRKNAGK